MVFHNVYSSPQEYISDDLINGQLDSLNKYFGQSFSEYQHMAYDSTDYKSLEKSPLIQFCLATELVNPSQGTIRHISSLGSNWTYDNRIKKSNYGGADVFQPSNCLNIWIGNLADTVSGYAQMPGGPIQYDGIVIDYRYFIIEDHGESQNGANGNPFSGGKTLTHLVGNYLGLYGLWGPSKCADDFVEDTPIHHNRTISEPLYKNVTLCHPYMVKMHMNFMDNTTDEALIMFTYGQYERMSSVLAQGGGPRFQLTQRGSSLCSNSIINPRSDDEDRMSGISVALYPNPSNSDFTLHIETNEIATVHFQIYDIVGKNVYNSETIIIKSTKDKVIIPGNILPSGIYYIHVEVNEEVFIQKVQKI